MSIAGYTPVSIAGIVGGKIRGQGDREREISELLIDSRRLVHPEGVLFVALVSDRNDGHRYIPELVERGVRCFLVRSAERGTDSGDPVFIEVSDTLAALQRLAAHHRKQFRYPVIGITGSNGKTVVKEWLFQLLSPDFSVARSPKSYNSRIGVPLSVWKMDALHNLAIIEAGISEPREMDRLEEVIRPTVGIFTNIGTAHAAHFSGDVEKVDEKLKLFRRAEMLIYRSDYSLISERLDVSDDYADLKRFTWGTGTGDDLRVISVDKGQDGTTIRGICDGKEIGIAIPFTDEASIENALHCRSLMEVLGSRIKVQGGTGSISDRFLKLTPVAMRMEMKEAIHNCSLINDSYSADISSLGIALDFLVQQRQHPKKTVILSDILQTGRDPEELYTEVAGIIRARNINRIIGIGKEISRFSGKFSGQTAFYKGTEDFLKRFPFSSLRDEAVLLKGARMFGFERISQALQQKAHETVLEINLDAVVHNLNFFRAKLRPGVKTMAMVKAFSYGSGSFEIAGLLQYHRVDYLAVAYADEGVELRNAGITVPVMVMSPEEQSLELLLNWNLEPEIYSFRILRMLNEAIRRQRETLSLPVGIHVKLDTGMHRLGFCPSDLDSLIREVRNTPEIAVRSVFSHLAASEEPAQDAFTKEQFALFNGMSRRITEELGYPAMLHILNSAGISRFPEMQLDMVRLGIGLYGIGHDQGEQQYLRNVTNLKTVITQIKHIRKGDTVGYNRKGYAEGDKVIAVVPVGYADGLNRRLGNGNGSMLVQGLPAPLIGNVCMDLCMLDITGIVGSGNEVREGDEVTVFGDKLPVALIAKRLGTIPYEIMTGISRRVKRIYFHE